MNPIKTLLVVPFLMFFQLTIAQTGPWARYDQQLKDDALYREASAGNLQEVKSIIAGGGNIHAKAPQTNFTILMAAAGSGKIEVVRYLLEMGADPLAKDWWGQTAADKAKSVGAKDIELLLTGSKKLPAAKPTEQVVKDVKEEKKERPEPTIINTRQGVSTWPAFASYKAGDSIIYWVATGWRKGVVKEVGVLNTSGKVSVDYSYKKYLIDPDAFALGNDWYEWTGVVRPTRQPFWTSWFIGTWQIGEVTAHHNEVKDAKETDTYYYMDATETLKVNTDGSYSWKLLNGQTKTGKWKAAIAQPGIVLVKAYRGFDWTLRNHTSVDDWRIRKLDIIELKPSAMVGTVKGKRKTTL